MSYSLFRELVKLTEEFEMEFSPEERSARNFAAWILARDSAEEDDQSEWEGKENGRSPESVINTSLVHLFRYAKVYSKIAINNTPFTTIDDVIFLLNLLHKGSMTKIELIEMNVHEKSTGIQIINRLLDKEYVQEVINERDKRSKNISITALGKSVLEENMENVRRASKMVVGNLTQKEKHQLIKLLLKLEHFHSENFLKGIIR